MRSPKFANAVHRQSSSGNDTAENPPAESDRAARTVAQGGEVAQANLVEQGDLLPMDHFFTCAYAQLRRVARKRVRSLSYVTSSLNATSLLHDCYIKLQMSAPLSSDARCTLPYLAAAMRSIVLDHIRRRRQERLALDQHSVEPWSLDGLPANGQVERDAIAVDEAIAQLEQADKRLATVAEMKFYGGFTEAEIAESLGIDARTVRRDWNKARAILRALLA